MIRRALVLALLSSACADDGTATTGSTTDETSAGSTSFGTSTGTSSTGTPTTGTTTTDEPTTSGATTTTTGETTMSETTSSNETASSSETTSTGDTTTSDETSTTDDTSTSTGASELCGDGMLDPFEACDDGNLENFDDCKADCTLHECGDGVLGPNEPCDDSNGVDDDACSNGCQLPQCGDGIVQAGEGEACDEGALNGDDAACTLACAAAKCGDGLVWLGEEQCDDGNQVDDDGCGNDCVAASCSDGQQNGMETDVDCGGPTCAACEFLLLLGGNANAMIGGQFAGASWTVSNIAAPTVDGVDVAIDGQGVGVGVFRYTKIGDPKDTQLQYVTWQAGAWSAPAQIGSNTTRAAPTLAAAATGAHVVFHGDNFQHYYARFTGGAWSPTAEMVGSFGPGPGAVAAPGNEVLLVFHDGAANNELRARRRTMSWSAAQTIDGDTNAFDRQPAVVALVSGEALAVHARNSGQVRYTQHDGGWSPAADVPGAQTSAPPALARLPGSGVALAFRGGNGKLYLAVWDGGAWTAPAVALASDPQIYGAPALATGIGTADLELIYLDAATKQAKHARRIGGVWTTPVTVSGTALERAAVERSL